VKDGGDSGVTFGGAKTEVVTAKRTGVTEAGFSIANKGRLQGSSSRMRARREWSCKVLAEGAVWCQLGSGCSGNRPMGLKLDEVDVGRTCLNT